MGVRLTVTGVVKRMRGSRTASCTIVGHRNDQSVLVAREEEAFVPAFIHPVAKEESVVSLPHLPQKEREKYVRGAAWSKVERDRSDVPRARHRGIRILAWWWWWW